MLTRCAAAFRPPAHGQHRCRERVGVFLRKPHILEKARGLVARLDARLEDALNVDCCQTELPCIEVNGAAAFRPPANGQHRWRERVGVFLQKTLSLEKGKGSV